MFRSSVRTMVQNKHQNQHKNVSLSTKWSFCHGCSSSLTWTLQKMSGMNWREEAPTWSWESEGSGEKEDIKEWSLVSCQVFSKLIRHYRRKIRTVILGKGRWNNWVPITVANVSKIKTNISEYELTPLSIVLLQLKVRILQFIWMKDQKDKKIIFIFTATFAHIYQGCQY